MTESAESAPRVAPFYILVSGSLHIDAPADKTWSHAIAYTTWQDYPIAEHVSGPVGAEGEVVVLKKTNGLAGVPYLARTVLLDPVGHRVVWKVYPRSPENAAAVGTVDFMGFVDFRVAEDGDGSRFSYNNYYEYQVECRDDAELAAIRAKFQAAMDAGNNGIWQRLKNLVEGA